MPNQFSNRPPFCDYLEAFQDKFKNEWSEHHYRTTKVGLRRLDNWLKVCPYELEELDWKKLLEFHRYLATQGISINACRKSVEAAKRAIRWGIETNQLPQKIEEIYTSQYGKNNWDIELPELSKEFLDRLEGTRRGSYRSHSHTHRVFHTFLKEKKLTYRRLRPEHMVTFIKYLNLKGFKLQTRSTMPGHLKAYFRWLKDKKKMSRKADDLIPSDIIPKKPKNLPRPIAPEIDRKLQDLLENTDDQIYKAILLIRRSGLRISECRLLKYDCIEYDIQGRASLIVPIVKLNIERRVPLDTKTIEIIKYLQEESCKNWKKKSSPDYLLLNKKGVKHRYEAYSNALTEICSRLEVDKWINLHALRHTYATSLLSAGMSIVSLKEVLGHKSINMSLRYAKITPEKVNKEYQRALDNMSDQQIPNLFKDQAKLTTGAFYDLSTAINRQMDLVTDPKEQKKLKLLLNRLSKLKMELGKQGIE